MRVVVLTGARQTGKTTLALRLGSRTSRRFHSLDSPETLALARSDPAALWAGADGLTIDEVQREPELLVHIKREVDRDPAPGRFLLTGSANILLMRRVSETLAGRAAYIVLPPLTAAERFQRRGRPFLQTCLEGSDAAEVMEHARNLRPPSVDRPSSLVFGGGYPEPVLMTDDASRDLWRQGYVTTYLERDLRNLSQIADLPDFLRFMRLAALRAGNLVNVDGLARDAGFSSSTARRYLNLLEVSFQAVRTPPYAVSRTKRLIKTPKLFPTDSGLACHLAGIGDTEALERSSQFGSLLETYVHQHLTALTALMPARTTVLYWRTSHGHEVDFVVESGERLLPIEVKSTGIVRPEHLSGLNTFLDEYPRAAPLGLVLDAGAECRLVSRRILALPWTTFVSS